MPGVSPTNNIAERAVRKPVLWRRGTHGSQSERGLRFVERILTVTATCRQRGDNVFDYLVAASPPPAPPGSGNRRRLSSRCRSVAEHGAAHS